MGIEAGRRILFVHAHPDDEVLSNGATMAMYSSQGAHVTLVTCTLGEEGEILLPDEAHRAADQQDSLAELRTRELVASMKVLGVTDQRQLGAPGKYRDSGMLDTPANERTDNFWRADLRGAADDLVPVIREIRPQVVVTYDDFGGYGHPDHIQAHRVATYAVALAAAPSYRLDLGEPWDVPKVYWTALPRSWVREGILAMREAGQTTGFAELDPDDLPFAVDDELVTTVIDARDFVEVKMDAMRAHASQIVVDGPFFSLSDNLGQHVFARESYRRVKGTGPNGESDLFEGVA